MEDPESPQHHPLQLQHNKVPFHLPAVIMDTPHREPFIHISPMPDNTLLAMGQDGLLTVWGSDLKLKKSRWILEENKQQNRKIKWISDCTLMPQYNKLIVGTCDREIRLYELSNFEPYCQIVGFETMPLHLGYSFQDPDECYIYFGDEQGCVNIVVISHMAETLRSWTKCQAIDDIPSVAIDNITELSFVKFIRWKVHNDWVTQIRYVHSIESIISSSNDVYTALVIGCVEGTKNLQKRMKDLMESGSVKSRRSLMTVNTPLKRNISDESHFRVKRGVKTFDFSKEANVLVTGGMDRIIRVWNPYVPGWPTGLLRGHSAPITYLTIADEDTKIYSVSTDCSVLVWDIESQVCLINVISKASQIRGEIGACYFSHLFGAMYIATDDLAVLHLQESACQHGVTSASHSEPVTSCLYNHHHHQIISCTEASEMKVWDLLTGQRISEVQATHGHSALTCLALDSGSNRLVTGSRDGSVKLWDYTSHTITFIRMLRQGRATNSTDGISYITYVEHNNYQWITTISCDGQVRFFPDQHNVAISGDEYPQHNWPSNINSKQNEGKMSLASSSSDLMATSDCAGGVCVWSLGSGDVLCHLHVSEGEEPHHMTDDLIINKVVFIHSRIPRRNESAILIASGPNGKVTFWNITGGGQIFARFAGSHYMSALSDMALSEDDSILCAADQHFYVYVWNISMYALEGPEIKPPALLHCWRAHLCEITRVIPVIKHKVVVTSSKDCTVKLWSIQGDYIGIFGQNKPWSLTIIEEGTDTSNNDSAYQKQTSSAVRESIEDPDEDPEQKDSSSEVEVSFISVDETDIAKDLKQINTLNFKNRMRTVACKQLELQQSCERLSGYKSLQICDLMSVPDTIRKPNPRAELNDPYDLAF
ncbi:cilia- and flagella-associated protein 337-like [Hyperolius riggenbachi]|uniref:cilia- and flagella-associated protein 337-like n=1 Tax=Hyperolius riggenbachi TaxID=752182 RepID=UPI0035A2C1DF